MPFSVTVNYIVNKLVVIKLLNDFKNENFRRICTVLCRAV